MTLKKKEREPDTSPHETTFEDDGSAMRLAEGGAARKVPPPEKGD